MKRDTPITETDFDAPTYNHALGEDRPATPDDVPADPCMATECDNQRKQPPRRATPSGSSGRVHAHTEIPCCMLVTAGAPGVGRSPVYSASVTDAAADAPTHNHALGDDRPAIAADGAPADPHLNRECGGGRLGVKPPHRATESGPSGVGHVHTETRCGLVARAGLSRVEDRPAIPDDAPADVHTNRKCDGRKGVGPSHRARDHSPVGVAHGHRKTRYGAMVAADSPGTRVVVS